MIDIMKELKKDYSHSTVRLGFIRDAAYRIAENGINDGDLEILKKYIVEISEELKEHRIKEEEELFPMVEHHDIVKALIDVMKQEHIYIRLSLDRIKNRLVEVSSMNENSSNSIKLYGEIITLVNMLSDHIHKENNILFPMIERINIINHFQTG